MLDGVSHVRVIELNPVSVAIESGAPGRPRGVPRAVIDGSLVPTELVAVTMNVYSVPLVSPVTVQVSGPEVHVQ